MESDLIKVTGVGFAQIKEVCADTFLMVLSQGFTVSNKRPIMVKTGLVFNPPEQMVAKIYRISAWTGAHPDTEPVDIITPGCTEEYLLPLVNTKETVDKYFAGDVVACVCFVMA